MTEPIGRARAQKEADKAEAKKIFDTLNANERRGLKFGLFPAAKMPPNVSHGVTCALMELGGTL